MFLVNASEGEEMAVKAMTAPGSAIRLDPSARMSRSAWHVSARLPIAVRTRRYARSLGVRLVVTVISAECHSSAPVLIAQSPAMADPGQFIAFTGHLFAFVGVDEEHVLAIVRPVAEVSHSALLNTSGVCHFNVAGREEHLAHVVRERVVERGALIQPERGAGCQ